MDWTTIGVAAGTFVGTGALSLTTQQVGWRHARRDRQESAAEARLAAREAEDAAEARELRREVLLRARVAAEEALEAVRRATREYGERGDAEDDQVVEDLLETVQARAIYLPDVEVRERVEGLCVALGWRATAFGMGVGTPRQIALAALLELREVLSEWLRTGGLLTAETRNTRLAAEATAAIDDHFRMIEEREAESREENRRDRDK